MQPEDYQSAFAEHLQTVMEATDAALESAGYESLLIHSGSPIRVFQDDYDYPFKPNPMLLWWAPVGDQPDCALAYRPGRKPVLYYYRPDDYWHGPAPEPAFWWAQHFDLQMVRRSDRWQKRHEWDSAAALGDAPEIAEVFDAADINPDKLMNPLRMARTRKTRYEVACMRVANRVGADGHKAARRAFENGKSEFAIHQAYLKATRALSEQMPYTPIIGLNEHAAVLHYREKDVKAPDRHRSFLIDAGAKVNGYHSDITRTYSRDNGDFASLIEAVDELQRKLVADCRPGKDYVELHRDTHRGVAGILVDHELVNCSADEALEQGITRAFFPHGLGHYIGLQTHDVAGHQADASGAPQMPPDEHPHLRLARTLETGNVVTIEPGVYVIDQLLNQLREDGLDECVNWARVDRIRPYGGVRIEDDVLVTEDRPENLTRAYLN